MLESLVCSSSALFVAHPLSLQKPGVGLRFQVSGTPSNAQLVALSTGTEFGLYWAEEPPPDIEGWERVMGATAQPSATLFTLPPRDGGHWLRGRR